MYYNVTIRRVPETSVAVEEQYYIFLSVCVRACGGVRTRARVCVCARVDLIILHATCRHSANCGPSKSTTFSTLSHKRHDFRKKSYRT